MADERAFYTGHPADMPQALRSAVLAVGNFDGVHRGHQAVLKQALEIAASTSIPAIALSFDPHPRSFFAPKNPVFRLTDNQEKARLLIAFGLSALLIQPFDDQLSRLSAEDFINRILLDQIGAAHIVCGHDFHFGHKRSGSPEFLTKAGKQKGFGVFLVEPFKDESGEAISSSRIRQALEKGDIKTANRLLGYTYSVSGTVIEGKKLGRTLGFPTANITLPDDNRLRHGIYAVRVCLQNGSQYGGVASFGKRPTIDADGAEILETHIFDFDGQIYGQKIRIEFVDWIRQEEKFNAINDLVRQMDTDCRMAKKQLEHSRIDFDDL